MSTHCPACGSAVDRDLASCPVCGETLNATADQAAATPVSQPIAPIAAASAGASIDAPKRVARERVICLECGAANVRGAVDCLTCGASLSEAEHVNAQPRTRRAQADSGGSARTYLLAGLAVAAIAVIIYFVSTPEGKMAPAQAIDTAAHMGGDALPKGHPPVDPQAQKEALNARVAEIEAAVTAQPKNDSLRLALANALYDAGRHADAKQHYVEYIREHPENLDATTDFATSTAAAGDVDSAIVVLNSVLARDDKHQRAAFNMAIMYRQKENRDSIMFWLHRVAEIDSTTPTGKGALDILREFEAGTHGK